MDASRTALLASLTSQRNHVIGILDGLSDDALRRRVLPSDWNAVGLVQHLAVDVERFWFRAVMADQEAAWASFDDRSAWVVGDEQDPSNVLDLYRDEISRADAVIDATPLDAPPGRWPQELFGAFRLADLQAVMLHVITETACHAGHLDAVRELIDGKRWMVL